MAVFLWVLAVVLILFWFLLHPGRFTKDQQDFLYGKSFAHRGLHTPDRKVPENSLPAFCAAAREGYGIELDIQLSKDGQVVVFHDDTLDRVCGVQGRVDSFALDELRTMRLCGTEETIPLFSEVLQALDGKTPVIVELKTGPHNEELCKKGYELMQQYPGPYCIESFDPRIVAWYRKNAPEMLRGQLTDAPSGLAPQPWPVRFALGHLFTNFMARPQFIAHGAGKKTLTARLASAGALRVCWTVRPQDDLPAKQAENDAMIFEFFRPQQKYK